MILVFWMSSFKPTSSLSSFTFIKILFSSSSLSAIRVMSSAYLRLLIFLSAISIPAYASSSLAFCMLYSAYTLNKHGDNIQPWCTPFPIWNQSVVPCPVLTVASWPAYRFLMGQVRWSGIPISLRLFHRLLWSTVKGFDVVNKAEIDVFWNKCFLAFLMIQRMLAIWPLVPLPFLNPAWTSGSSRFTYCWSLAWRILSITLLVFFIPLHHIIPPSALPCFILLHSTVSKHWNIVCYIQCPSIYPLISSYIICLFPPEFKLHKEKRLSFFTSIFRTYENAWLSRSSTHLLSK